MQAAQARCYALLAAMRYSAGMRGGIELRADGAQRATCRCLIECHGHVFCYVRAAR